MAMQAVDSPPKARGATFWPLTLEAYHFLAEAGLIPENTELLYGFVYNKMSKSPLHSYLLQAMQEAISRSLPPGKFLRTEQPITCDNSEPEPDLAVIAGTKEQFRTNHPHTAELVVEVCVTSHDYDRLKLRAYATAGVKECWYVLGPEKQIEVFSKPSNGKFVEHRILKSGDTLTTAALPTFALKIDELFSE
jgi:Uma2 family endonuclease